MKNKYLEGKCICGQVKYKLSEKPLFTQACHCKDCKILTGSSYVVNSSVLENTLIIDGEISCSVELKGGSGAPCKVYYCAKFGRLNVRTKTLNNAIEFSPQAHIFTKDKDPWLDLKDNAICFEKMYDPKITWPKESLERYKMFLENKSQDKN
jgi:hypothetical protein